MNITPKDIKKLKIMAEELNIDTKNYNLENEDDFIKILNRCIKISCDKIEKLLRPEGNMFDIYISILCVHITFLLWLWLNSIKERERIEYNINYYFTELIK